MNLEERTTYAIGVILAAACHSNDVPEHEPTLVTVTSGDDDGADANPESNEGADETTAGPTAQCWPNHSPDDPALYQCIGIGMGDLHWEEYALSWKAASLAEPVVIEFPPQQPDEPNVQACCESDAVTPAVTIGCIEDCARAACNVALERLAAKLAAPPDLCSGACLDRFADTLTTWISFIEANYDDCLQVARGEAGLLKLPDPASASDLVPTGAGRLAELTLACTMDAAQLPYETDATCETSPNEPSAVTWEDWSCPEILGEVEIGGTLGTEWAPVTGSATLRRGICSTAEPCWFAIERLELEATSPSRPEHGDVHTTASLAYQGFGRYDDATDVGTIATGMLGLDVTMTDGERPELPTRTAAPPAFSFAIANSDTALVDLGDGTLQIVDAWFAWDELEVTLTTDVARCSCTSCP